MSGMEVRIEEHPVVNIVDLGTNSKGSIGPDVLGITPDQIPALADEIAKPEYRRKASDVYGCVDGRAMEGYEPDLEEGEGLTQVAGSKALQDTASDLMQTRLSSEHPTAPRVSKIVADRTRRAVSAGFTVVVHGKCGANITLEDALRSNAENADVVAPIAWSLSQATGIDEWLKEEDITEKIVNGKQNADDGDLFDVNADERLDIMVANGAKRVDPVGQHTEAAAAVTLDPEETVDARAIADEHKLPDGREIQAFVVTLGKAVKDIFKQAEKEGRTELEAAHEAAGAILWNIAVTKELTDESIRALLLARLPQAA